MGNVQRLITIGCIVIGLLVLVGTVSAFFSPTIQAVLTVPSTHKLTPGSGSMNAITTVAVRTQPAPKMTMTALSPSPAMLLAQDTFQRGDQNLWGTASDGQRWGANANNLQSFSVAGQMGMIANGPGAFDATLGPCVGDADVVFSGSLNLFSPGAPDAPNIGSILRWSDTNNWYKAYIDGSQFILIKKVAGKVTLLNAIPFPAQNGQAYTLRFRSVGTMLMAKAWLTGQAEPANWMVTANDTALSSGFGGLRIVLQKGSVARITMFMEMAAGMNP